MIALVSLLPVGVLAGSIFVCSMSAQSIPARAGQAPTGKSSPATAPAPAQTTSVPVHSSHYEPSHFPKRAVMYYGAVWGIDSLSVKAVESGELIRFTYRITDPNKATVFNDKKIDAFLDAPAAHARLVIPTMEKVGQLRQYNTPEAGMSYWMAFSNPRLTVKRGDRVNIVIGQFHADGLIVE